MFNFDNYLDEVHENISKTLHIIPPALLDTKVGVDAGVPSGASQVLVFPVGDVLVCPCVSVLLGQAEVNNVDKITLLPQAPAHKR